MKLTIHSQGIKGSGFRKQDEQAAALFRCVIEIDGHLIEEVTRVHVITGTDEFSKVIVHLIPGEIEHVSHTEESWNDLFIPNWIKQLPVPNWVKEK